MRSLTQLSTNWAFEDKFYKAKRVAVFTVTLFALFEYVVMSSYKKGGTDLKKSCKPCGLFLKHLRKIRLVDRCLLLFMMILMIQSTYNLFVNEANSAETHIIDVVVRTTTAGIFGYLLSPNFFKKKTVIEPQQTVATTVVGEKSSVSTKQSTKQPKNKKIGFATGEVLEGELEGNTASVTSKPKVENEQGQQQVIIATVIGIFALIVMLLIRDFTVMTPAMASTGTQMRDFVSACVGFLLGSPGTESE